MKANRLEAFSDGVIAIIAAAMPRGDGQQVLIVLDEEPLASLPPAHSRSWATCPPGSPRAARRWRPSAPTGALRCGDHRRAHAGNDGDGADPRAAGIRREIPILLMSGYLGADVVRRAREVGADELLKKPVSASELAIGLARVLRQ